MSRCRRPRGLMICLVLLLLLWGAGCSRPDGLGSAAPADQHPVPFHDGDSKAPGSSNAGAPSAAQDKGQKPEGDLPFRDLQSLPAGTLLTVRLKSSVSADNPDASGTFEAVVDEPVTIEGYTLVPRGAGVAGRVESARASSAHRFQSEGQRLFPRDSGFARYRRQGLAPADLQPVRAGKCRRPGRCPRTDNPREGPPPYLPAYRTGLRCPAAGIAQSLKPLAAACGSPQGKFSTERFTVLVTHVL